MPRKTLLHATIWNLAVSQLQSIRFLRLASFLQKLKLPVQGVNLPNLFILTYKDAQTQFYINAFNRGLIFSKQDIENYINELHLVPQSSFFEACTSLEIIRRALRNLVITDIIGVLLCTTPALRFLSARQLIAGGAALFMISSGFCPGVILR